MPEQITYYHDTAKVGYSSLKIVPDVAFLPWEIALEEAGASYKSCGFDIYNKPTWFAQANPLTGKIPVITYGGPDVPPEEPSPQSCKVTESLVILEFLADIFPDSGLLPPTSDPTARARVRFFIDAVARDLEVPVFEFSYGVPGGFEKMLRGLKRVQALLPPDPKDGADSDGGEDYAIGKEFTIADCAIVLALCELFVKTDLGKFEPGMGKKLGEMLEGAEFERLGRYRKALWERKSVKKVVDFVRDGIVVDRKRAR